MKLRCESPAGGALQPRVRAQVRVRVGVGVRVRLEPRVRRYFTRQGVRERCGGGIHSNRTEGQDKFYAAEMLSRGGAGERGQDPSRHGHPGSAGCDECAASPPGAAGRAGSPAGRAGSLGRHCGVRRVRSATVAALRGRRSVTLRRGLLD